MRLFIGIPIPDGVRKAIYRSFTRYRDLIEGVKWVEMENLHITLKFLGEVSEEKVKLVEERLERLKMLSPFEICTEGVGAFPSMSMPKVIWIGIGKGFDEIVEMNRIVEKGMEKLGFKRERRFHPHITLGRVKRFNTRIRDLFKEEIRLTFNITSYNLYQSILHKEGPEYRILKNFKL